MSDQHEKETEV